MGSTSPDLHLVLDRGRPRGLRAQIEAGIRSAIRGGRLRAGTRLPSTRALAADLGVTRRVVVEAYDQLVAEGYVVSVRGAGTVVNAVERPAREPVAPSVAPPVRVDFRPGFPDHELFPRTAWGRASRAVQLGAAELSGMDRRGLPRLRAELAEYLARVRGVDAHPDRIVVCAGFGHAFDLLVELMRERTFAVEDPGYPPPRARLARGGIPVEAVPVDGDGLVVERLRATRARVAVVTPAHQSPIGVPLSPRRRHELVAWARAVDGYVVEDDFDAEFRYDRRPVGALQGLAPDRVVYCGTTAKTLAVGLRLGWVVLPDALVDGVCALRAGSDGGASGVLQATFAELLRAGDLDRHLRRSRRVYRARRDAVVAAVARWLPEASVSGIAAGLTAVLDLPAAADEHAIAAAAAERGVRVYPRAPFHVRPGDPGLLLGYGAVPPEAAEQGVRLLADAVRETTGPRAGPPRARVHLVDGASACAGSVVPP